MKKRVLILMSAVTVMAQEIVLTPEQEQSWKIRTEQPVRVERVPLGTVMAEVTVPPALMRTLSLPFEARVTGLNVARYAAVEKGDTLATVSGNDWIGAQKEAIADHIALREEEQVNARKHALCDAEIIAQKECVAADTALQTAALRFSASKAVLKAYGADETTLTALFDGMAILPDLPVKAPVAGHVTELNVKPGDSVEASRPVLSIKQKGAYWLETEMDAATAAGLAVGRPVRIGVDGRRFDTKVLELAPVVDAANQTRYVRFALPQESGLMAGLRTTATVTLPQAALLVPKKCVVKKEEKSVLFVKQDARYDTVAVKILAEDASGYYLEAAPALEAPVVINAAAVLKAMLGDEGNE